MNKPIKPKVKKGQLKKALLNDLYDSLDELHDEIEYLKKAKKKQAA